MAGCIFIYRTKCIRVAPGQSLNSRSIILFNQKLMHRFCTHGGTTEKSWLSAEISMRLSLVS
jgi:hypothetical protein